MFSEDDSVPDDVELDDSAEPIEPAEEEPAEEDEAEEPAPDDEPGAEEAEPEPDQITMTRAQFDQLLSRGVGAPQPPPTDEAPDPLEAELRAVLEDKTIPVPIKRVMLGLARKVASAETTAHRSVQEAAALSKMPAKHQSDVQSLVQRFNLPVEVAHQLYKGNLYDKAVARAREKKRGGEGTDEVQPAPTAPRVGSSKHTSIRPVRSSGEASSPTVTVQGIKVPKEFQNAQAYEKFMAALPSDQHRAVVFKARRTGSAATIRGE